MALMDSSADERIQPVRRVYEHTSPSHSTPASLSEVFHLECYYDDVTGKDIVLWDDILAAFKDVVHVRAGAKILPFLKGQNFKTLDPFRIAAVPGVTLDVVVTGQSVRPVSMLFPEALPPISTGDLSLESLQKALSDMEHGGASSIKTASSTFEQNPAYRLVKVALENYTHIEHLATSPPRQGSPTPPDRQSNTTNDDDIPEPLHYLNKKLPSAPQEHILDTTPDFVETIAKARLGEKDAQLAVGNMYRDGQGVAQDYLAALDWFHKAADQGCAEAKRKIACSYMSGFGVQQDYSKAMEWFLKAAGEGNAAAQHNTGYFYRHGLGVPQDYAKAMEWYLKAANQGGAYAQNNIGVMYTNGMGVAQDDARAVEWYRKAAEQGLAAAQYNLGVMYEQGQGVGKDNEKAMEWYRKAAGQGNEDSKRKVNRKPGLLARWLS